jgi:hypothetical protein
MAESRDQQSTSSQTLERPLNEAIIHADISLRSCETDAGVKGCHPCIKSLGAGQAESLDFNFPNHLGFPSLQPLHSARFVL